MIYWRSRSRARIYREDVCCVFVGEGGSGGMVNGHHHQKTFVFNVHAARNGWVSVATATAAAVVASFC